MNKQENACPAQQVACSAKLPINVCNVKTTISYLLENATPSAHKTLMKIITVFVLLIPASITVAHHVSSVFSLSSWKMAPVLKNALQLSTKLNCSVKTVQQDVKPAMITNFVANVWKAFTSNNIDVLKSARQGTMP